MLLKQNSVLAAVASEKLDIYADYGNALYKNISLFSSGVKQLSLKFRSELRFHSFECTFQYNECIFGLLEHSSRAVADQDYLIFLFLSCCADSVFYYLFAAKHQ